MIGNQLELSIIGLYSDDLTSGFTILQISKLLKKAYPYINRKVNEFIFEGILIRTIVGKSYLCHLNIENSQTTILLTLIQLKKLEAKLANEPETEALVAELNELRKQYSLGLAAEFGKEIVIASESRLSAESLKDTPLLNSRKIIFLSYAEFRKKLEKEHAAQIFFGNEMYFFLFSQARGVRR